MQFAAVAGGAVAGDGYLRDALGSPAGHTLYGWQREVDVLEGCLGLSRACSGCKIAILQPQAVKLSAVEAKVNAFSQMSVCFSLLLSRHWLHNRDFAASLRHSHSVCQLRPTRIIAQRGRGAEDALRRFCIVLLWAHVGLKGVA